MLRYIVISIFSFLLGVLLVKSCDKPNVVKKFSINKNVTDTLYQQVDSMQKAKKEVKLKQLASIQRQVDTFKTIDTSAKELIKDLVVQIAKRDTIIDIDSMQIKALVDISNIQMKQIDTLQTKLDEASVINETLVTQANKPKNILRGSIIANFVLLIGLFIK
jgi:hypothetical protein